MKVIGLLTSEEEANELKFIARVCTIEDRVHYIVHLHKVKSLLREKD